MHADGDLVWKSCDVGIRGVVKIAVVAHAKKNLGGGLPELRAELRRRDHTEVAWHEVMKSNKVPDAIRAALAADPELLLLWGGDGTVQRALDTVARKKTPQVPIAVLPAGTSNLFASNFDIPQDLPGALDVALGGVRVRIDVGSFNGERFGVMAGVGFDALMIGDASRSMKDRLGRAAYVYTGLKNLKRALVDAEVRVDDRPWFTGSTPCVLVGNVGDLFGGITLLHEADPSDGRLDIGVLHTERLSEWARLAGRALQGEADQSGFLSTTSARRVDVRLSRRMPYELDGGARGTTKHLKVRIKKQAVTICIPDSGRTTR
jgi:diacylglycerol kinase family enzyme